MANNANNFRIGGNDEHGINPPTFGKRTPVMPYINRQIFENEFNRPAKIYFLMANLRTGFNVFDVKPEDFDVSIASRVTRINQNYLSSLVTFAYNAAGNESVFSTANGIEVYYSPINPRVDESRTLAENIYNNLISGTGQNGRGVKELDVSVLSNVNCPSTLAECGFMTNFNEAKLMIDPDYQKLVGEEACQGVCQTLNVDYVEPITDTSVLPTLRVNDTGKAVQYMQFALIINGFNPRGADGIFGANTETAVRDFQAFNGLTVDGIVGRNTWAVLLLLNPASRTLRRGNANSYVRYLQQKLNAKLYNTGVIDGIFGLITETAVREFQSENNLAVDGIVGRNTWARLLPIGGGRPFPTN